MEQNVPVPASVLRDLIEKAKFTAFEERKNERYRNEQSILEARRAAYEELRGAQGSEFVSLNAVHLSTLTGFSDRAPAEASETARTFLEKYGVW